MTVRRRVIFPSLRRPPGLAPHRAEAYDDRSARILLLGKIDQREQAAIAIDPRVDPPGLAAGDLIPSPWAKASGSGRQK